MTTHVISSAVSAAKTPGIQQFDLEDLMKDNKAIVDNSKVSSKISRCLVVRLCLIVMGIEFSYSVESAFVSPIILRLGIPTRIMTLVWTVSPIVGCFLLPLLGSLSDNCVSRIGKRRPFVIGLSVGLVLGLLIVPNVPGMYLEYLHVHVENISAYESIQEIFNEHPDQQISMIRIVVLVVTVIGVFLLDFCSDACQSPSRALLLDIVPDHEQSLGLTTFTMLSGFGGFIGYVIGGIDWTDLLLDEDGHLAHERIVFAIVTVVFIICMLITVTALNETTIVYQTPELKPGYEKLEGQTNIDFATPRDSDPILNTRFDEYKSVDGKMSPTMEIIMVERSDLISDSKSHCCRTSDINTKEYVQSLVTMPSCIFTVCVTNLFCWMALVCYTLFFTHFMGETVYQGRVNSPMGSLRREHYDFGLRMGSYAMSVYAISCCVFSLFLNKLIFKIGLKTVYICSLLISSSGTALMAILREPIVCFICSANVGILYACLFTVPYILIAKYHSDSKDKDGKNLFKGKIRGIGTDIAVVSSMVFIGQLVIACSMGLIIQAAGSAVVICICSSVFSTLAAISATQIVYM